MRLVQISDTHFGTERPPVVEALAQRIHQLQPDVLLLCGDITQRARRSQFAAARAFMDRLPRAARRVILPGNHDIPLFNLWARLFTPYENYRRSFGERETLWKGPGCCILALDATHPSRHTDGALPAAALQARLAEARAACGPQELLIVAAHQPLWTTWEMDRSETLYQRERIARQLAQARVDLVLSGHVHVPMIETSQAVDATLPWQFVLSGSGTAVSHRTRVKTPNSFNLVHSDAPDRLRIEQFDYQDKTGFELAASAALQRGSGGWAIIPKPADAVARPISAS